jgi:predicted ArsR family transcriptional regulator
MNNINATDRRKTATVRTRRAIVQLLKQEGPLDAQTLAERLHISAMAVRQHLYALQDERLVIYAEEPRPMGRPVKLWQLTPAADRFFPEGYAELTLSLVQSVTEAFGKAGLEQLLAIRTRQQIATYRQHIAEYHTLPQRLAALAAMRTAEGYMAEVQPQADGSFLLCENHCPICVAAAACTRLCGQELAVFQAVLGADVDIERTEHIVAGARRCAYRAASRGCLPGENADRP